MFLLEGCKNFYEFHVEDRPRQIIYLIGEHHNLSGNGLDFIQALRDVNPCSIDVIVEKEFQTMFHLAYPSISSNVGYFLSPPLLHCSHPLSIPEPIQMRQKINQNFFKNCIEPYGGKLKIWATDIRKTSIFYIAFQLISRIYGQLESQTKTTRQFKEKIQHLSTHDKQFKLWLNEVRHLQKAFLDFDLFVEDSNMYHEIIMDALSDIFRLCPSYFSHITSRLLPKHTTIQQRTRKILTSRDKSHMKIAEKITQHIPPQVYKNWQKYMFSIIDDEDVIDLMLFTVFFDLESIYRIYNLLKKQKEGFIVVFAGSEHIKNIANMMQLEPELHLQTESKSIRSPFQIRVNIPFFPCTEKTQLIRHYQRIFNKRKAEKTPSPPPTKKKIKITTFKNTKST